jgi:uncharacterized membrane protein YsdA (DUF1294 family)/cold shock CspA family protein
MANDIERTGKIVDWNDSRGFGFIADTSVSGRIFFHIKDVGGSVRPAVGDDVAYEPVRGRDGRPAARSVLLIGAAARKNEEANAWENAPMRVTIRIVGALALATTVLSCVIAGRAPLWLAACYVAGGVVSFVAYWLDKRAAKRGAWRTREETLHIFDLAFGIVGGLTAQGLLRHKSSKQWFGIVSAAIFALHMTGLCLLLAGYGPVDWLAWLSRL